MEADNRQLLFEKYLDGKLSPENLAALQKEAENDPELLEELKLTRGLIAGLRVQEKRKVRAELTELYNASKDAPAAGKSKTFPYISYGIAASVLVIVVAVVLLYSRNSALDKSQELFASYYKPMIVQSADRGDGDGLPQALAYYSNEDYQRAAKSFEAIIAQNPTAIKSKALLGNCYLLLGRTEEAISLFEVLKNEKDPFIAQYSHWYLSLAYLKAGRLAHCRENLLQISKSDMVHSDDASELLTELQ